MATDWGPVVQTGIGAVAALGGGVIGARLQVRHEERIERQRRRDRAAALLAEVSALLRDSGSKREILGQLRLVSPEVRQLMRSDYEGLKGRQNVIGEQLVAMAIGDPSPKVQHLVRELEIALDSSLFATWYQVVNEEGGPMDNPGFARLVEQGDQDHRKALALLDELIEEL